MESASTHVIREIVFCELYPDKEQAYTAAELLRALHGVQSVALISNIQIRVSYDLFKISLREIDDLLSIQVLHLGNRLLYRLKRALHYYTEETQRANRGVRPVKSASTHNIFIEQHRKTHCSNSQSQQDIWSHYRYSSANNPPFVDASLIGPHDG